MRCALIYLVAASSLGALAACEDPPAPKPHPLEMKLKKRVDATRPSAPPTASGPWRPPRPRVGDFVEYRLDYGRTYEGRTVKAEATVRLQAIEVTEALTRIHASSPDVPGWFCGGVVFELSQGGARKRAEPATSLELTTERVGDRDFKCYARRRDASMVDGPRAGSCERSPDEALALGDGLVRRSQSQGPRGGLGGASINLLRAGHDATLPAPAPLAFPRGGTGWRTTGSVWDDGAAEQRHQFVSTGGLLGDGDTLVEYLLLHLPQMALPPIPPDAERYELPLGGHRIPIVRVVVQEKLAVGEFTDAVLPVEYFIPLAPADLVAPWPVRCGALSIRRGRLLQYQVLDWE